MTATISQFSIHSEAMSDAIRDAARDKFYPTHVYGDFEIAVPHAQEFDYLPTFIPALVIDGVCFKATLLRFDRGMGTASYGIELI